MGIFLMEILSFQRQKTPQLNLLLHGLKLSAKWAEIKTTAGSLKLKKSLSAMEHFLLINIITHCAGKSWFFTCYCYFLLFLFFYINSGYTNTLTAASCAVGHVISLQFNRWAELTTGSDEEPGSSVFEIAVFKTEAENINKPKYKNILNRRKRQTAQNITSTNKR